MQFIYDVLTWIHFMALAVGGAATFGIPVVGMRMAKAAPEARPMLMDITFNLGRNGARAIATLFVTGLLMVWIGRMDVWALSGFFWIKMAGVLAMLAVSGMAMANGRKAMAGDASAAAKGPVFSKVMLALLVVVVACAVVTF